MSRPHGRARVNSRYPEAFGVCQRCGIWYNLVTLRWQFEFAGRGLYNTRYLFCPRCLDTPQPQLKARIIPADPVPKLNARVEPFAVDYDRNDFANNGGVLVLANDGSNGYPTSPVGLIVGAVWNNGTTIGVIPGVIPDPAAPPMYFGGEISAAQLLQYGGGNLPSTNPNVKTQLWNNGGVICVS